MEMLIHWDVWTFRCFVCWITRWIIIWSQLRRTKKIRFNQIRGKKITCPGARDKLNFRQDKHICSPNVRRTSKELSASIFFLDKDKLLGNRTSKNFDVLVQGQVKIFRFFYPCRLFRIIVPLHVHLSEQSVLITMLYENNIKEGFITGINQKFIWSQEEEKKIIVKAIFIVQWFWGITLKFNGCSYDKTREPLVV